MRGLFEGPAARRAPRVLDDAVAQFAAAGYETVRRRGPLEAELSGGSRVPLRLRLVPRGRVFGGTYGLEISTADAVLPATRGLSARGRGTVRFKGVTFRARRGDGAGHALAEALGTAPALSGLLGEVHFEEIRVEADGHPLIRHMGGSLVWILVPPIVKAVPLVPEQAVATARALQALTDLRMRGAGLSPAPGGDS